MNNELAIIDDVPVISASWRQLGVLVLDGSGSMLDPIESAANRSKAEEVNIAVRDMLTLFKVSRKAPNFSFALVTHHDRVTFEGPATPLVDIDDNGNFDPTANGTGGTLIACGLESAGRIARQYLDDDSTGLPSSVVILGMSDGECSDPARTKAAAAAIKADPRITIATAFFATKGGGSSAGPDLLKDISSDPATLYKTVYDAATLRKFFQNSMTVAASTAGLPAAAQR